MVGIEDIVKYTFGAIICVLIIAALWWAIGYFEKDWPAPLAWKVLRGGFVLLVVFFVVCVLLAMIGHPLVRF